MRTLEPERSNRIEASAHLWDDNGIPRNLRVGIANVLGDFSTRGPQPRGLLLVAGVRERFVRTEDERCHISRQRVGVVGNDFLHDRVIFRRVLFHALHERHVYLYFVRPPTAPLRFVFPHMLEDKREDGGKGTHKNNED